MGDSAAIVVKHYCEVVEDGESARKYFDIRPLPRGDLLVQRRAHRSCAAAAALPAWNLPANDGIAHGSRWPPFGFGHPQRFGEANLGCFLHLSTEIRVRRIVERAFVELEAISALSSIRRALDACRYAFTKRVI